MVPRRVGRLPAVGAAFALCSMLCACTAGPRESADPGPPAAEAADDGFSLDASVRVGRTPRAGVWTAEVHVPSEGDATVRFMYFNVHLPASRIEMKPFKAASDSDPRVIELRRRMSEMTLHGEQRIPLDGEDRQSLLRAIEGSGFFGEWPPVDGDTDEDSWTLTARRGGAGKSRDIYDQPEFREAERLLWRVIHQAVGEWALAEGRLDILDDLLHEDAFHQVLHPERFPEAAPPPGPK